jgi:uncharacterized protein YciI
MNRMSKNSYLIAVEEAQQELDSLLRQHSELLKKIEELKAFINAGRALAGVAGAPTVSRSVHDDFAVSESAVLTVKSIADHIVDILQETGKPLHVKEIVSRLRGRTSLNSKNPKDTVLTAIKRRGDQFKRVAPATFALSSKDA